MKILRFSLPFLALVSLLPVAAQDTGDQPEHRGDDDAVVRHRFQDAESWAKRFEDPARDAWQLPDRVVKVLAARKDLVVADIGSATGYFPVRFARACPEGLVLGADIEPDMVHYLNDRARREGLTNLVSILAAGNSPHLPMPVDLVFICNTYHHIDARIDYFRRLQEQLTEAGRVAVVDFRPSSRRVEPVAAEHICTGAGMVAQPGRKVPRDSGPVRSWSGRSPSLQEIPM